MAFSAGGKPYVWQQQGPTTKPGYAVIVPCQCEIRSYTTGILRSLIISKQNTVGSSHRSEDIFAKYLEQCLDPRGLCEAFYSLVTFSTIRSRRILEAVITCRMLAYWKAGASQPGGLVSTTEVSFTVSHDEALVALVFPDQV